ncbi:MAG: hypothetical protein ABI868_02335 [Acidobacteriota bacterium]
MAASLSRTAELASASWLIDLVGLSGVTEVAIGSCADSATDVAASSTPATTDKIRRIAGLGKVLSAEIAARQARIGTGISKMSDGNNRRPVCCRVVHRGKAWPDAGNRGCMQPIIASKDGGYADMSQAFDQLDESPCTVRTVGLHV